MKKNKVNLKKIFLIIGLVINLIFFAKPISIYAQVIDGKLIDGSNYNSSDTTNFEATNPVTDDTLEMLNPLKPGEGRAGSEFADQLSTPGGIISRFLGSFAFPIAGLILFVMLVWGGFEMFAGAATQKSMDAGKQRVTSALIGFLLLFASYWIANILELMFGIQIL